jgi:hypothetical protein
MLSRSLTGLLLAVGAIGACRTDRPVDDAAAAPATPAAPSLQSYTFTATDYTFSGPAQMPAGPATLRLVNRGKELHHVVVVRLDEGKTLEDLSGALKQPGPPPKWAREVGGPNAVDPNGESNATLTLTPGQYAAICFIPAADGVPHFAKGMVTKFEVTPTAGPAAAEPTADVVMKLTDYAFDVSTPLKSGENTVLVENVGPQTHEVTLARLTPGKTLADFGAWAAAGFKGPPPASFIGGTSPMHAGERNIFSVKLEPGEYVLLCFVPDAKDGKEHLVHGMAKQVTVS